MDEMRIVSHRKLKEFYETPGREDAEAPLDWNSFAEIKMDFRSVDAVGNQHFVFNIHGNKYRLVVVVKFVMGYVFIRFVGTHQEYEKIDASAI